MPVNPTPDAVHQDQLLTNISILYRNPKYIADEIFPVVNVNKQSGLVPKYDQSHWFRNSAMIRAVGTASRRGGFKVTKTDTYYTPRYSFGFEIPDELRDNQDEPFNMDRDGTQFVTEKMMLCREVAFATDFFASSKGWTDKAGGTDFTQWSDYAASQPLVDVATYMDDMEAAIGVEPNTAVFGKQVYLQLKWHPDLIDTIKYTQRGVMTPELMASLLEIPKVLVGRAIQVTSAEGVAEASATYARIWGKSGLILYVPPTPSVLQPAAGYTFVWNRVANAIQYIKRMRDEEKEIDIVEGNSYFDHNQTSAKAGTFLGTVVA